MYDELRYISSPMMTNKIRLKSLVENYEYSLFEPSNQVPRSKSFYKCQDVGCYIERVKFVVHLAS